VTTVELMVYGDFGSPACYLASRRVDALRASGIPVDWRAVETDPGLPVGGRPIAGAEHEALERELERLDALLLPGEELPLAHPAFRPHTRAAVAGYAEAYVAGVADDVRRLLFDAYWTRGADIGSPESLRRLIAAALRRGHSPSPPVSEFGYAVSPSRSPITTDAYRRIRDWSHQRELLGDPPVPFLVVDERQPVSGETALRRLEKELLWTGASGGRARPDAAHHPELGHRPDPRWVSEIGGRWRHAWKADAT
jgi:predicted DsbA family dithiol-disulfide isomerase